MAYEQVSVTSITQIPAAVAAFAAANGWTVAGQNYKYGSGVEFALSASISGFDHELKWARTSDVRVTSAAKMRSPKLNGTSASPEVSVPSSVHLFAGTTPAPFLAIVVEYGFNSYRHLYLGYVEKHGFANGGEVIGATGFPSSASPTRYPITFRDDEVQYLFGGRTRAWDNANTGGVLVDHAANPTKWRRFYSPVGINSITTFTGTEAIGGFKDDINDAYIARARSSAAGINLLVPIHLYAAQGAGASVQFIPLGPPAGVRAVNMTDLDPKSSIAITTDEWMVFPALSKAGDTVVKSLNGWGAGESSGMVGYAYRKN